MVILVVLVAIRVGEIVVAGGTAADPGGSRGGDAERRGGPGVDPELDPPVNIDGNLHVTKSVGQYFAN